MKPGKPGLKKKVQTATETLGVKMKSAHNIEKFMTTIRKYTQLEKLTPKNYQRIDW